MDLCDPAQGTSLRFVRLKQCVSIRKLLSVLDLLPTFRQRGRRLYGPCPIHRGDNRNAFVISLEHNLWHCFTQCGRGGDVVDLARALLQLDYAATAHFLASLINHEEGPLGFSEQSLSQPSFRPFTRRLPLIHDFLWLQRKQIRAQTARRFEVGFYAGNGFLKDCVAARLHNPQGEPLGYLGRRLESDDIQRFGKYKCPSALPKHSLLYNYHRIGQTIASPWVVVECPWAVLRLAQLDIPAVGLLGVTLSAPQQQMLMRASSVVLMLDGDPAGRQATGKLKNQLEPHVQVKVAWLPDTKDPDDLSDEQLLALIGGK